MDKFNVGIAETAKRARPNLENMKEDSDSDEGNYVRRKSTDEDDDFSDPDATIEEESNDDQEQQRPQNNKRSKRQRRAEPKEKEERIRSSAQDNDGPSTLGPPPDFQLAGLDGLWDRNRVAREVRYQRETWDNSTSESPEAKEQNPEHAEKEKEDDDDRASSSSGSSNSSTSLEQYQRGYVGPLCNPPRRGAVSPAEQETEVDYEGNEDEEDGPQPLGWLSQYRGAQLFEKPLPYQGHERIHVGNAPVFQREIPHGVRWPEEVSLHDYLAESGPLLPEDYFGRQNGKERKMSSDAILKIANCFFLI